MAASLTVVFPTTLVIRKDGTTNQLANVDVTCTLIRGHKEYALECSDLAEGNFPKAVVFTTKANVQEYFEFLGVSRNDEGEVQFAHYYRQDCNGTAHFLKVFND